MRYPAVVSPFLAHYAVGKPSTRCSLLECRDCSFRFFDSRLTAEEVAKLYSAYRGEEYFQSRRRYEFWYTRKFNTGLGHDPGALAARKQIVADFLGQHAAAAAIRSVLDYGGDEGQFIPEAIGREKFVYDLSDARPVPGVTKVASDAELRERTYDLVMICHVLEHCSDPCDTLAKLRELGGERRLLCYVELPYERYDLRFAGKGRFFAWYLDMLLRLGPLLTVVDFYTTLARMRWSLIPPLGVMKCHEHLNFFNEKSLESLLRTAGFDVLACGKARVPSCFVCGGILQALARARAK